MQITPKNTTSACNGDAGTLKALVTWSEFQSTHLQLCTQELYTAQGWNADRELGTKDKIMLQVFQQQVFHMVNVTLTASDA